eukprot:363522-Chlamydomonas_euryale.AAC.5
MPLFAEVANPALQARHWAAIYGVLDLTYDEEDPPTPSKLLDYGIMEHFDAVQAQGAVATKEYSMLKALDKMEAEWRGLDFKVKLAPGGGEKSGRSCDRGVLHTQGA